MMDGMLPPGGTPRGDGARPVLVTGGAGFIGTNLAARLAAQGRPVILYDNLSRPGVERNLTWLKATYGGLVEAEIADIRDHERLAGAVARAGSIFHFAAQVAVTTSLTDPVEDFEINALGTLRLLEAVRAQPRPPALLFSSTNKVYGSLSDLELEEGVTSYAPRDPDMAAGVTEDRPLDFHSPYGCSKGAADQYVVDYARSYGLPAAVLRMSCIYGPHQFGTEDQGWVAHFLIAAREGRTITLYGTGKQVRDILFVDDLVDAFLRAEANIDQIQGQAFNMGGGACNALSLRSVLNQIEQLEGAAPAVEFGPWRTGDQPWYVANTARFEAATGWRAKVDAPDGIGRLHRWLSAGETVAVAAPAPAVTSQTGASRIAAAGR